MTSDSRLATLVILIVAGVCWVSCDRVTNTSRFDWKFEYGEGGLIERFTSPGGVTTRFAYEYHSDGVSVRRIVRTTGGEFPVSVELGADGLRRRMADFGGSVAYEYDDRANMTSVCREGKPCIVYRYDELKRTRSVAVGSDWSVEYVYDFLGRLSRTITPVGVIGYEYQSGQGRVIRTLPNGIQTTWSYAPSGDIQSIAHTAASGEVLLRYDYRFLGGGRIGAVVESGEDLAEWTYDYDEEGRLVSAVGPERTIRYAYDPFGNRTARIQGERVLSSSYSGNSLLLQHDGSVARHDGNGNLASYSEGDERFVFGYTGANLLQNAGAVQYRYDGDGYLIARESTGGVTEFVLDPLSDFWRPLLAVSESGEQTSYIWEGRFPIAVVGEGVEFLLHDHLGSVRAVVGGDGAIGNTIRYEPFGHPVNLAAESRMHVAFAGLFYDPSTGLYITRGRAYSPQLGRFLQMDPVRPVPMGVNADLSSYVYSANDPVNMVDVNGLWPVTAGVGPGGFAPGLLPPLGPAPGNGGLPYLTPPLGTGLPPIQAGPSGLPGLAPGFGTGFPGQVPPVTGLPSPPQLPAIPLTPNIVSPFYDRGGTNQRKGGINRPPPGPQPPLRPPKPPGPDFPWPEVGPDWGPAPGGMIIPDPTGPGGQAGPPGPDFPTPPLASRMSDRGGNSQRGGVNRPPPGPQPPLRPPRAPGPDFPWPKVGPNWGPAPGGIPDPAGGAGGPMPPDFPTPGPPEQTNQRSVGGVFLGVDRINYGNRSDATVSEETPPLSGTASERAAEESNGAIPMERALGDFVSPELLPADRQLRWQLDDGREFAVSYDSRGRPLSVEVDGVVQALQTWNSNGRLSTRQFDTVELHWEYGADGSLERMILTPPGRDASSGLWRSIEWDAFGNMSRIRDDAGLDVRITANGSVFTVESNWGSVDFVADESRKSLGATSSWGDSWYYQYSEDGGLTTSLSVTGGAGSSVELDNGRITRQESADGGVWAFDRLDDGSIEHIRTPSTTLEYEYDALGRPTSVRVGTSLSFLSEYDEQGFLTSFSIVSSN